METLKKMPCWMKIGAAVVALIFVLNWPDSSGEWAAWVQAVGVIAAVIVGFASSALERRRLEVDKLLFLLSAVRDLYQFLEIVEEAMEVQDEDTGVPVFAKPGGVPTEPLRVVFNIIEETDLSTFPFEIVKQIRESLLSAVRYADALDKKEFDDFRESLRNTYQIFDVHVPKNALKPALAAIEQRLSEVRSKPLFAMH